MVFDVKHITSLAMLSASIYAGCRIIFLCVSASLGFDGHVSHHYHWRTRAVGLFGTGVEWSNVIPGSTPPRPPPTHIIALMQDCFWVCTALLRWLVCFVPNRNWQIVVFGMKHTKFLTILISHFHAGWQIIHSLAYQLCSKIKVISPTNFFREKSSGSISDANVEWSNVLPDSIPPHHPPANIHLRRLSRGFRCETYYISGNAECFYLCWLSDHFPLRISFLRIWWSCVPPLPLKNKSSGSFWHGCGMKQCLTW